MSLLRFPRSGIPRPTTSRWRRDAKRSALLGGVIPEGDIVVTSWTDEPAGNGGFFIHRPDTDHGGLKTAWEVGNIQVGTEERMILVRQRGNIPSGTPRSHSKGRGTAARKVVRCKNGGWSASSY